MPNSEIQLVCSPCGTTAPAGTSMMDVLEKILELGWGLTDCGLLVCPSCIERVATRLERISNAHLN